MKKKYISIILASAALAAACSKTGADSTAEVRTTDTISAEIVEEDTKTSLDGVRMLWSEGDELCVCVDPNVSTKPFSIATHRFGISEGAGSREAQFKSEDILSGARWSAVYPYSSCSVKDGEKYIYVEFPSTQEYVENGVSDGIIPLYATGTNPSDMKFAYGCGIARLNVYSDASSRPVRISKIEVITDVPASGTMVVTPGNSRFPFSHNGTNKQTTITYNVPDVQLSTSAAAPTVFNISLAATGRTGMTAYSSVEFRIYATNGAVASRTKKNFQVAGGVIYNLPAFQFDGTVTYNVGDWFPDPNVNLEDPEEVKGIEGIVFSVSEDGSHGKILSLVESSGLKWNTTGAKDETLEENDGMLNWEKIKAKDAAFADYPAFAWCASLGDGWYIPAINELIAVRTVWGSTKDSKDAFNKKISDVGGQPLTATVTVGTAAKSAYYYSSTEKESAANKALSLSFNGTSGASDGIKKSSDSAENLIFRAIKKF